MRAPHTVTLLAPMPARGCVAQVEELRRQLEAAKLEAERAKSELAEKARRDAEEKAKQDKVPFACCCSCCQAMHAPPLHICWCCASSLLLPPQHAGLLFVACCFLLACSLARLHAGCWLMVADG